MKIDNGNVYLPSSEGHFISEKQRRISEILKDYDPYLQLQWIAPVDRGPNDYAFRVVHAVPGRPPYPVTFADECDERLLAKVFQADNKGKNVLNFLEAHNSAVEALRLKSALDEQEEMNRMAHAILRSRKINYMHKGFNFGREGEWLKR